MGEKENTSKAPIIYLQMVLPNFRGCHWLLPNSGRDQNLILL
jgi:hypothetical protein